MEVKAGYKQTELGVIPEDWEVKPLEAITECLDNLRIPLNESQRAKRQGEIPYCGANGILDYIDDYVIDDDIILMAEDGGYFDEYLYRPIAYRMNGKCWVNNHAHILKANKSSDQGFVYYSLVHKNILRFLASGTRAKLNRSELNKIEIALPLSKVEQETIATALSDVDALLAAQDKLVAKKRDIKQAAMQQLLTGKQRLPGLSGEWKEKRLVDICWFQEGPGVRNTQFTGHGVKLLNGTNIVRGKVTLESTSRYISEEEAFGCYKHFLVDDGDILIASSGVTIDRFHEKVAFASSENLPLCMNTSTIRFKADATELLDKFLYFFLQSDLFKEPIGKQATGSAQLNFGPAHLKKINVTLPPNIEEQSAIAEVLSDMDAELSALEQQRDKTRALKQGMMQELLTGKIRLV